MPHALIVDDDRYTREALSDLIAAHGFTASTSGTVRDARIQIGKRRPDVMLVDLTLPDGSGMDLFGDPSADNPTEIILITGDASIESAVTALRRGAVDYLVKPINFHRLKGLLARVPQAPAWPRTDRAAGPARSGHVAPVGTVPPPQALLGESSAMQSLHHFIERVAATDVSVLLRGESGTGKELVARRVHDLSQRSQHAFLPVNCAAISPHLIESEIFGHEKGSFTGADRQHKGYFERASGGTLFLDEITEMPLDLQVKLLRVLENGSFARIGSQAEIVTDVRIVAATNRDPDGAVTAGKLRLDLYHRLNGFPMHIPPLRERGRDIELLAMHFLQELNLRYGLPAGQQHRQGRSQATVAARNSEKMFSAETLAALKTHHWPGNVRELRNYVQRGFILADHVIEPPALDVCKEKALPRGPTLVIPVGASLAAVDRKVILATLELCSGVKKRTADVLGISLKTLYNRLEEYARDSAPSATPDNDVSRG